MLPVKVFILSDRCGARMGLQQAGAVGPVFEDPLVSERWDKLVEWLDRYGVYWREEMLGLVTHVELLVSAAFRAAERLGLDKSEVSREVCERVRALMLSRGIDPELVKGFELKGVRREVAETVATVFPGLRSPSGDTGAEILAARVVTTVEPEPSVACPECGSKLVFLKTLKRYYCFTCKKYR